MMTFDPMANRDSLTDRHVPVRVDGERVGEISVDVTPYDGLRPKVLGYTLFLTRPGEALEEVGTISVRGSGVAPCRSALISIKQVARDWYEEGDQHPARYRCSVCAVHVPWDDMREEWCFHACCFGAGSPGSPERRRPNDKRPEHPAPAPDRSVHPTGATPTDEDTLAEETHTSEPPTLATLQGHISRLSILLKSLPTYRESLSAPGGLPPKAQDGPTVARSGPVTHWEYVEFAVATYTALYGPQEFPLDHYPDLTRAELDRARGVIARMQPQENG